MTYNFIHIPKAGGSSMLRAMQGHDEIKYCGHAPAPNPAFAFTRHPYDRLISAYVYLMNGGIQSEMDLSYRDILLKYKNFEDFVFNITCHKLIEKIIHIRPMTYFVCDKSGNIETDLIFKIEEPEAIEGFLSKFGVTGFNDIRLGASGHRHYTEYLCGYRNVIREINRIYWNDFKIFDYKMIS